MARNILTSIKVYGLLGSIDLNWPLRSGVNILAGGNGSGKSTLLRAVAHELRNGSLDEPCRSLVASLDVRHKGSISEVLTNFDDFDCRSLDLSRVCADRRDRFFDIVDSLFSNSGKTISRSNVLECGLSFDLGAISIPFAALSSGERQVLKLLLTLLSSETADVLLLDEPEISLQIDWQKVLLDDILILNPDIQILVATHSPAIVMNGWVDCVSEISDLIVEHSDRQ